MAENYVVNCDINVRLQPALTALRNFQQATTNLSKCGQQLTAFQRKIESVTAKFSQMTKKTPVLNINTKTTEKRLD